MSVEVRSLGSGSSGNALLIIADGMTVVVDCGITPRTFATVLRAAGFELGKVDAVLLSHEHVDHVRGLPPLLRNGTPVISTAGTARAAGVPTRNWHELRPDVQLRVGGLVVTALPVAHDAAEPCGFLIEATETRVCVLTDLGSVSDALRDPIADADLIVLEANHDEAMLRRGPYPPHLIRRILSAKGHLSNATSADLLTSALRSDARLRTIWLAHLSTTNNRPALAQQAVRRALAEHGQTHVVESLPRHGLGPLWRPGEAPRVPLQMALPFEQESPPAPSAARPL